MPDPRGYNQYATVTVAVDAYPGSADVSASFHPTGLILKNRGTDPLLFSHDGTTNHGRIENGQTLTFRDKLATRFWFKRATGAASNAIDVILWG